MLNVLLQVLDDGRITDGQGRTVDFKNAILILTSNLGSDVILEGIDRDGNISDQARDVVMQMLKTSFRPEFLNRLDEIVFYRPLTKTDLIRIVDLLIADLEKRLANRQLKVEVTDSAKEYIVETGSDPVYGARPLKRYLQSKVETLLARRIIAGDAEPGSTLVIDKNENGLFIR